MARHGGPLAASPHLPCHGQTDTQRTGAQPTDGFRRACGGKLRQGPPDPGAAQDTGDINPLLPGHDERPCPQQSSPGHSWGPLGVSQGKRDESHQAQSHMQQSAQQQTRPLWSHLQERWCGATAPMALQSSGRRTWDISQLDGVGSLRNIHETMGEVCKDCNVSQCQQPPSKSKPC